MNLFHSSRSVTAAYDFPTTRKAGWVAESLAGRPIAGVELVELHRVTVAEAMCIARPVGL